MRELVRYIADFEATAGNLYAEAAEFFNADPVLSSFLKDLEKDEISHYDMMNRVYDIINETSAGLHLDILIGRKTKERLESPIVKLRESLARKTLDEAALMGILVDLEYSEWNDVFIYIIDTMKDSDPQFQHTAAKLEAHKRKIGAYLQNRPGMGEHIQRLKEIRHVWDERILVIDDEPAILQLFHSFLRNRYTVDSAMDGNEALGKISGQYYDVIISDVTLPGINGINLYREATKKYPDLARRIIFFTGDLSLEYKLFFEKEGIQYFYKPVSLEIIEEKIQDIIARDNADTAV
jgi:CheY-like chemotaxis protein